MGDQKRPDLAAMFDSMGYDETARAAIMAEADVFQFYIDTHGKIDALEKRVAALENVRPKDPHQRYK